MAPMEHTHSKFDIAGIEARQNIYVKGSLQLGRDHVQIVEPHFLKAGLAAG